MYDLKNCIHYKKKPFFGYECVDFDNRKSMIIREIMSNLTAKERQDHMINYANKCFTFGKPVWRDTIPGDDPGKNHPGTSAGAMNKIGDI